MYNIEKFISDLSKEVRLSESEINVITFILKSGSLPSVCTGQISRLMNIDYSIVFAII